MRWEELTADRWCLKLHTRIQFLPDGTTWDEVSWVHVKSLRQAATNEQRSQQRSRHHCKVSWHQLCQHNIKRYWFFWYDSFAHHAVKRNHTIVDGLHLEFSVLIWVHLKCDHGFVATKWSVSSRQHHLQLFRAVWAHNLQWDRGVNYRQMVSYRLHKG